MTIIGFVRHGVTAWNKEGRAQGSSNIPLDEEGVETAKKLAVRLADEEWDAIFTSPLTRARQTADLIASESGIEVVEDERLRERSGGLIEGTTEPERQQKWGPQWRELDLQFETAENIVARGLEFVNDQVQKNPNQRLIVVSHGSFIKRIIVALMEDDSYTIKIDNTSLTIINIEKKSCLLLNDTAHLVGGLNGNPL
ncbi:MULTISPECIES: histidine phosphatase family protein [unclassified Sporosarcina]|uniref:histidine phosphatase family protein n=1 Tax=unclassified Sporosarcina TaxID=2647733 RepID=UPI000C162F44|nr:MULTISPECIES: histidine phosphatase family protein [unclassified Sporosarcina]PID05588.1 histidine phosphatase family protein [Sporosarcina sp. P30]PID08782.1 histidine phosphatase family protein [Sporosarcina sp. P31]PID11954.1 histidine phosphatase family protein [Sporosarcina sp. P32b]